jgi:hypothetical protein
MNFDYSFPAATSSHFKYSHDVSVSAFNPARLVTSGVSATKVDNPSIPTPFYEIPIKYDYSEALDGSILGPLVVTTDDEPLVVEWGVNPPGDLLIQKSLENKTKLPNHSIKIDLSEGVGEKFRNVFLSVKAACVQLLAKNLKTIGSHGGKVMSSGGDPVKYFDTLIKAHDMVTKKLPNGDSEFVPAKYLNVIGFTNVDKVTNKQTHVIKTHFYAPGGGSGKTQTLHVKDLVKKKLVLHPYIYFQRIYCGATISIQSFLDSAMVLKIDAPMSRELTSSAKKRLEKYSGSGEFPQLVAGFAASATAAPTGGQLQVPEEDPAPPAVDDDDQQLLFGGSGGGGAGAGSTAGLQDPTADFDKALAEAASKAQQPRRTFRRVSG